MQCWNCHAENDEGYTLCWFCKEPARPGEGETRESPPASPEDGSGTPHRVVHRAHTVERHTARSLDELPPEIRERILRMQADAAAGQSGSTYTYRGPDGRTQTFSSLDEMPPDVRAVFERGPHGPPAASPSSRRLERAGRRPPIDAFDVATDAATVASPAEGVFALWAGGVLAAGLLVGLGLAGLITLPALGSPDAAPPFLGVPLEGSARVAAGVGFLLVGGLLHAALFWGSPARRSRRFHGLRLFLTCVLAGFLLGNLHLLTTLLRTYQINE